MKYHQSELLCTVEFDDEGATGNVPDLLILRTILCVSFEIQNNDKEREAFMEM